VVGRGWDLLLTPTLAEPPTLIGTFANDPAAPMTPMVRAGAGAVHTGLQRERAAGDQPAVHWNSAGPSIGVQLVAAYGCEDATKSGRPGRVCPSMGRPPPRTDVDCPSSVPVV
jgi:amidase